MEPNTINSVKSSQDFISEYMDRTGLIISERNTPCAETPRGDEAEPELTGGDE